MTLKAANRSGCLRLNPLPTVRDWHPTGTRLAPDSRGRTEIERSGCPLANTSPPNGHSHARHSYASYLIAAGANPKAISTFMGHSSINLTYDLYGHLTPGTEVEVASLLGSYLDREIQQLSFFARKLKDR